MLHDGVRLNIAVLVKTVPDIRNARLQIRERDLNLSELGMPINEQDSYALEEGVRLKEKFGGEVLVISMGDEARRKGMTQVIRECYAKGADRGLMIIDEKYSSRGTAFKASLFAQILAQEKPSVVFMGSQSADTSSSALAPMLSELLSYNHASLITSLSAESESKFRVTRDLEGGIQEELLIDAPCVFSTQTGINTPRYAALSKVIMATKKEIKTVQAQEIPGVVDAELKQLKFPEEKKRDTLFIQGTPEEEAKQLLEQLRARGIIQR